MSYYFLYKPKKVPTLLAYSFIIVTTLGLTLLLKGGQTRNLVSRATKNLIPQNLIVSNITSTSATVSFTTEVPAKTVVKYGSGNSLDKVRFDERDLQSQTARRIHYFILRELSPSLRYKFAVSVEGREHGSGDPDYQFTTLSSSIPPSSHPPLFGKVVDKSLNGAPEILVELTVAKSPGFRFTTLTKETGEWIIPLPVVLDNSYRSITLAESDTVSFTFRDADNTRSAARAYYKDGRPLKTVVIGQDYDFTLTGSAGVLGTNKAKGTGKYVLYPRTNSIITTMYPSFRGTGKAGSIIQLSVQPNAFSALVNVDRNGEWRYENKTPLMPGKYELTATEKGAGWTEKIVFLVGKSGETVLGEATPSASITPDYGPTVEPTGLLGGLPTYAPTPSPVAPTVTQPAIPVAGVSNNLLILMASGISLFGLLLVLY